MGQVQKAVAAPLCVKTPPQGDIVRKARKLFYFFSLFVPLRLCGLRTVAGSTCSCGGPCLPARTSVHLNLVTSAPSGTQEPIHVGTTELSIASYLCCFYSLLCHLHSHYIELACECTDRGTAFLAMKSSSLHWFHTCNGLYSSVVVVDGFNLLLKPWY